MTDTTYVYYKRPEWELKTKCIVCGELIIHNQYQKIYRFNRIAHLGCTKRYWKK